MAYGIAGESAFMAGFAGGYMVIGSNSGFVGAMVAGFIAGVITNEMQQFTGIMPGFLRKASPIIIIPVFNLLLMQLLSVLVISPVAAAVGGVFTNLLECVVGESHLAGSALVAMMMSTDMGGIINKVGYNYGVESIASGNTDIMAAVMIGGMVPPIGIFLSTLFFRDKYTEAERDRGPSTLFMGLAFITEGALPYVFTDIFRVIPSCMLGSAVAGFLSALMGCTLPAPHGGVFVFPVMGHPVRYALALAVGSAVTAVILGMSKRKVEE
jgi:fructose-specific phosphotransferase system IIC component